MARQKLTLIDYIKQLKNCPRKNLYERFHISNNWNIYVNGDFNKLGRDFQQDPHFKYEASENSFDRGKVHYFLHSNNTELTIQKKREYVAVRSDKMPPLEPLRISGLDGIDVEYNLKMSLYSVGARSSRVHAETTAMVELITCVSDYIIKNNLPAYLAGHISSSDTPVAFNVPN